MQLLTKALRVLLLEGLHVKTEILSSMSPSLKIDMICLPTKEMDRLIKRIKHAAKNMLFSFNPALPVFFFMDTFYKKYPGESR